MKQFASIALSLVLGAGMATALRADPTPKTSSSQSDKQEARENTVRRGQTVLLVALAEGIRLSAPGRALKNGRTGDTIPVVNTATRRSLKGVIRDGWIEIPSLEDSLQ